MKGAGWGRRVLPLLLAALVTACGQGDTGAATDRTIDPPAASAAAQCPRAPFVEGDPSTDIIWPGAKAEDLVPTFTEVCALPTSPHLFGLLNEAAAWAAELEAAALGVLAQEDSTLATFSVLRAIEGTNLGPAMTDASAETTAVGDLTLAWASADGHVAVYWIDGLDIVALSAANKALAVEATSIWLRARGVEGIVAAPDNLATTERIPAALRAGPPVERLPDAYTAFALDPIAFMGSDVADAVTIFEEKGIEALGSAVVVSDGGKIVGTIVSGRGYGQGVGRWPEQVKGAQGGGFGEGAASAGFTAGGVDVLIVGYDQDEVESFITAWKTSLVGRD